jgi:predicted nucleic acid-binding protein
MKLNVIDSCGWLEYFADNRNEVFFTKIIEQNDSIIIPIICIYEVYKRSLEQRNETDTNTAIDYMKQYKIIAPGIEIALLAAKLSKKYKLAMADSFILATAYEYEADVWTQDSDMKDLPNVHYNPKSK